MDEAMLVETLAMEIARAIGPKANVRSLTNCMTRLRVELKKRDEERLRELASVEGVLGMHTSGEELQVILGPSRVQKVRARVEKLLDAAPEICAPSMEKTAENASQSSAPFDAAELHEKIRKKNATPIKLFFRQIASVFLPLIPGFIACGLITGVLNALGKAVPDVTMTATYQLLTIAGGSVFFVIHPLVGRNAAEVFGGTPVLGAMLGALIAAPALSNVMLFGTALVPDRGGIISVLLAGILAAVLEKKVARIVPEMFSLFLTPLITFLIMAALVIFVLQPVGGVVSDGIGLLATGAVERGGAAAGFLLGGLWLPLVMLGVHQVFTPIHAELLARYGVTILLPILAMAGAGQVGASLAVYTKTKDVHLKKVIASALPVGILGIGEPLIYGVTLPLFRPFIGACIGGAFGGAVVAAFSVGAAAFGISGLPLAMATDKIGSYLFGLIVAYIAGFIATRLLGFDDSAEN